MAAASAPAIVTSPCALASEAGAAILEKGGNAIEAAIAVGAVLSVSMPHFCGLGGDAVWMISDENGNASSLLGVGQAIASLDIAPGQSIPLRGPGAALTTAGAVASWDLAHTHSRQHWQGSLSFAELIAPAIAHAENGVPVSRSQVFWQDFRAKEIRDWPGIAAIFVPDGKPLTAGDRLRQPALARSLETIAIRGAADFYDGALAARIVAGLNHGGVPMTRHDLAATRARFVPPVSQTYRDLVLFAPPMPTQGVTTLMAMGMLEHLPVAQARPGSGKHLHLVVEAIKQAFLCRDAIADPDFSAGDARPLLDAGTLSALARRIDPEWALPWPQPFRHGDTVHFAVRDAAGRGVSVLQSTYFDWGSGVVAGDTGIIWHNRGAAFSTQAGHADVIVPGKRPFMTLNPGLALREGKPALFYGTQGADGQPQTLALLLTLLIDFGLTPEQALAHPRFLLGRTFSDSRDTLKIEQDCGEKVLSGLERRGHEISLLPALSQLAGHAGVIAVDAHGKATGAHDPRGDGKAIGLSLVPPGNQIMADVSKES